MDDLFSSRFHYRFYGRVDLPNRHMEAQAMSKRDIQRVIVWFEDQIARLENSGRYPEVREGVNRLRGMVEVLEGELYGISKV
jgi:hypothetical protein